MKRAQVIYALAVTGCLVVLALAFSSPIAAKPGWSHPGHERIKALDWSVEDGSHDPATLQQARELRLALRAEIREVLTDAQLEHMESAGKRCPRGGQPEIRPVRQQTTTLYL
ncbi:MAG: hypothetical protein ACOC0Q_09785 [Wenzhouxiangella sp.]